MNPDAFIGPGALSTAGRMASDAVASEPWRAVTALTLHADADHLAANALGLGVFGLLLGRRTGLGVSVLVAVAGGALGNVLDAYALAPSFSWVGASTAVCALLGACASAYRSILMVLLGVLLVVASDGDGINTGAHACGLVAGMVVGALVAPGDDEPHGLATQLAAAAAAVAMTIFCWSLALGAA